MDNLYTRSEAAEYLGVSPSTIKLYIVQNRLPAFKKGRAWLFLEGDLKSFKESEWFQFGRHQRPGAPQKYPDDMPRLHEFTNREWKRRRKQKREFLAEKEECIAVATCKSALRVATQLPSLLPAPC